MSIEHRTGFPHANGETNGASNRASSGEHHVNGTEPASTNDTFVNIVYDAAEKQLTVLSERKDFMPFDRAEFRRELAALRQEREDLQQRRGRRDH